MRAVTWKSGASAPRNALQPMLASAPGRIFSSSASRSADDQGTIARCTPLGCMTEHSNLEKAESGAPSPNPLHRAFFARNPRRVARELLGKVLVRKDENQFLVARVVEIEAYLGENDPAAHAAAGNTPRTSVLFGPPGHAYVYFIYGNHYCLNVSCERDGKAGSVLFRALEPLLGIEQMAVARGLAPQGLSDLRNLTSGPGRLAQAFGITRTRDNGGDLTSPRSGLWIGEDGFRVGKVEVTPRIGISKAADQPLRYTLSGNAFVSRRKTPARD
jgi:DNA-3-methyladenine glycosylase